MHRYFKYSVLIFCFSRLIFGAETPAALLTLDQYREQVKAKNQAFQGSTLQSKGALERARQSDLTLSPSLFANLNYGRDSKLPQIPLYAYSRLDTGAYQVGLSQLTNFGLQGRLFYDLDSTSFVGANIPEGQDFPLTFFDAKPVLELTQSFWSNGFGRSTKANLELLTAQQLASSYGAQFQAKQTLLGAELVYWRLASAREAVQVQEDALLQAQAIYDWTSRRTKMNLADEGDSLQAMAALQARRLELAAAQHEEQEACRSFNGTRNTLSSEVPEKLSPLEVAWIEKLPIPERKGSRDDVKAAEQQAKASQAGATMAAEKTLPTLDLSASYALNGRDITVDGTLGNSYTADRPTLLVGLKFQMPLDVDAANVTRAGAVKEQLAAEKTYQQKLLDEEQTWSDLVEKVTNAKARFQLALTIEKAQQDKLIHERKRLKTGRTTTYQVLLFEQDFSQAELNRVRLAMDVISLISQMKLYSGETL